MVLQIIGIPGDGAGLSILVLGPGVLSHVGNEDGALSLVVEYFAHVHIQSSFVRHRDFRRAVRSQYPAIAAAIAGAGDPARQIDFAARRVDVLHKQLFRGRIPIDLRLIVKGVILVAPLRAAVVDLVHGAVLYDGRASGGSRLRRIQLSLRYRGGVGFIAALDQSVHIDGIGGHIDIPPGNIAGRLVI